MATQSHPNSVIRRLFVWGLRLSMVGLVVLGFLYWKYIVAEPGDHISISAINQVISRESPVYYRDGEHKIGVFFSREHREYVQFADIPT